MTDVRTQQRTAAWHRAAQKRGDTMTAWMRFQIARPTLRAAAVLVLGVLILSLLPRLASREALIASLYVGGIVIAALALTAPLSWLTVLLERKLRR